MTRYSTPIMAAAFATSAGSSTAIPYGDMAGGVTRIVSGTGVTLTYFGADKIDGTYTQIYDAFNVAVSRTVATSRAYPIPDECFGVPYLKIVANAALVADVFLKS